LNGIEEHLQLIEVFEGIVRGMDIDECPIQVLQSRRQQQGFEGKIKDPVFFLNVKRGVSSDVIRIFKMVVGIH